VGILIFAFFHFRRASKRSREIDFENSESAFMAMAMQEAVAKLRDKEQAQQARADASERLSEDIVAGLTSGLIVVSADGRARLVNPAARRFLDLPLAAPGPDMSYSALLKGIPPLAAVIEETLRTREPIMRRVLNLKALGIPSTAAHLGVTASPIMHPDGRFQGLICLFSDLTSVMHLEEQLRLRESLAQVGEMTAGIAHEFRNSLATIHGYAHLIELAPLSARDRTCVEGIRQETIALGEVLTNFLHFAKPVDVALEVIELRGILERVLDEIRAEVATRGGSATLTGPGITVQGDEVLLRQAFGNLCRNAMEACAAHGTAPVIAMELRVDREHRQVLVTVTDNGPGVEPVARDRMFQPFFTTKAKGTGLGLALVQKIIVMHNGRIAPFHPDRGGLRMEITLPLAETPAPAASRM
jgi:signal transduction histidine kinase